MGQRSAGTLMIVFTIIVGAIFPPYFVDMAISVMFYHVLINAPVVFSIVPGLLRADFQLQAFL